MDLVVKGCTNKEISSSLNLAGGPCKTVSPRFSGNWGSRSEARRRRSGFNGNERLRTRLNRFAGLLTSDESRPFRDGSPKVGRKGGRQTVQCIVSFPALRCHSAQGVDRVRKGSCINGMPTKER